MRIDAGKWAVGEGNEGQREGRQWRLSPEAETPHFLRVGECLCDPRYSHTLCRFVWRARTWFVRSGQRKTDDEKSSSLLLLWIVSPSS